MSRMTLKTRFFLSILQNTQGATLVVTFPDGRREEFGQGNPRIEIQATSWQTFDEIIDKGDLGLAESIVNGDLIVNDVAALIQWACYNDAAIERLIHGTWFGTFFARLRKMLNPNSKSGAKKNIMAHYDLGNSFYQLWLDPSMTYSSALYASPNQGLQEAQMAKYDRIIEALDIRPEDHVLEVGCGWGGFFSRAVEKTGCKVTAVMNSPAQAAFNRNLIRDRGYAQNVDLRQIDYRDIDGRFDKIVSIEMVEAVGEQYWPAFFGKVTESLKTGGQALIQSITIQDDLFDVYRSKTDFIQRYVFPGGMLLAPKVFADYSKRFGLLAEKPFEFGISYADTLKMWKENFEKSKSEVRTLGFDDKFLRLWDLYLGYCEGAFRAERINVGHYHLQK
ncbi:class I SAM-dependent methyltransferase [Bdellovibrio sp. HCB2-146]|uniref:class I SAM-dependent methyltransferase n=1 Tax=Bdellovibrio sp. HCB2-146 TaxID=3394362 RepID=UPI0039BC71C6